MSYIKHSRHARFIFIGILITILFIAFCGCGPSDSSRPAPKPEPPPVVYVPCDGMGNQPAVFDDFSYLNTDFDKDTDNEGSVFGSNVWSTCNDGAVDSTMSRLWYRYNQTDVRVNPKAKYVIQSPDKYYAKLIFRMESGYDPTVLHHHPIIRSGLKTREGTYAARVQFSELEDDALLIQSFWTQNGPGEVHAETDIEWNNWFELPQHEGRQTGESYVHATNHSDRQAEGTVLSGRHYDGQMGHEVDSLKSADGGWWTIAINITPDEVKYAMKSDVEGGGTIWAGAGVDNDSWGVPKTIAAQHPLSNLPPEQGLNSQFGFLFANSPPYFAGEKDTLSATAEMLVEWFYYSPEQLSLDEVEDEITNHIDREAHGRFNTTSHTLEF